MPQAFDGAESFGATKALTAGGPARPQCTLHRYIENDDDKQAKAEDNGTTKTDLSFGS